MEDVVEVHDQKIGASSSTLFNVNVCVGFLYVALRNHKRREVVDGVGKGSTSLVVHGTIFQCALVPGCLLDVGGRVSILLRHRFALSIVNVASPLGALVVMVGLGVFVAYFWP